MRQAQVSKVPLDLSRETCETFLGFLRTLVIAGQQSPFLILQEYHQRETTCPLTFSNSLVGLAARSSGARAEKKSCGVGCWRSSKSILVRDGHVH